jgi:hypothetical protein
VNSRRARVLAPLVLGALLLAEPAPAQPAPPLEAVLVLDNPPANLTFDGATPIKITLGLRNVSGAPVITTDGFSATDFWRQLYFALDGVGVITDAGAAAVHAFAPFGTCHYRSSALLPGPGIAVVPVELLPADFRVAFVFDDAGKHFDLTRPGRYTVTAKVSFVAYDPGAVIDDCNVEFKGKSLLSIGDSGAAGRQQHEIVSNSLEFLIQPPDGTPPTTTAVATPLPNATGWHDMEVSLALTAADNPGGSGVRRITVSFFGAQADPPQTFPGATAAIPITAEGATTVFYQAEDSAGNKEDIRSETVRIDQTPPLVTPPSSVSVAPTEAGGARGSASPALAAFLAGGAAEDNLDPGPARLPPQVNGANVNNATLFPPGTTLVVFRFVDAAGNLGSAMAGVRVGPPTADQTPPATTATPATTPKGVTVALAAQDNPGGSGVQQIVYTLSGKQKGSTAVPGASASVVITGKGVTTLSYFAVDRAGNAEAAKTLTVEVDGKGKTNCKGAMAGNFDDLVVPDRASCVLSGANVKGGIDVRRDASLAIGPVGVSAIRGKVEADRCRALWLTGAVTVDKDVRIRHCSLDSGYEGPGIQLGGDFECRDNSGACRAVNGSVRGDVTIEKNRSASPSEISGNTIRGTLRCQGNVPAPTHGAANTAKKKEGQCDAKLGF